MPKPLSSPYDLYLAHYTEAEQGLVQVASDLIEEELRKLSKPSPDSEGYAIQLDIPRPIVNRKDLQAIVAWRFQQVGWSVQIVNMGMTSGGRDKYEFKITLLPQPHDYR